MTEIPIAARIPQKLEQELKEYMKSEHLEKSIAIRKLLYKSLQEWREERALKLLTDGKITLLKAAEFAGIDIWELVAKIKEKRVQWVSDEVIERDLAAFR